jgi:hypothetical protein
VTERFYGLTYDRLRFATDADDRLGFVFGQAAREALPSSQQPFDPPGMLVTARMSRDQARQFHARMISLVSEFEKAAEPYGDEVFGIAGAVFATDTPKRRRQ